MSTFEEQFPSLKDAGVDSFEDEEGDNVVEMEEMWFPSCSLEEFCLDKQKVKEAFEKFNEFSCKCEKTDTQERITDYKNKLLKGLGL